MSFLSSLTSTTTESPVQRILRIGLICLSFGTAILVGTLYQILLLWSGELTLWPIASCGLLLGLLFAWLCRRYETSIIEKVLAILYIASMLFSFWDINALQMQWQSFVTSHELTFSSWIIKILWFTISWLSLPLGLITFLWVRNTQPKGRLSIFMATCIGLITANIFTGHTSTTLLILFALYLMLGGICIICLSTLESQKLRQRYITVTHLLIFGLLACTPMIRQGFFKSEDGYKLKNLPEPLQFYPFAPIAAKDVTLPFVPPNTHYQNFHGAYIRTDNPEDIDTLDNSQQLAYFLQPATNARRGFRPLVNATEDIKGVYDVLWVEVPPAWQSTERDYFDDGVVRSLLKNIDDKGCLIYHIDIRPLTLEALLTRAEALSAHFPYIELWRTSSYAYQLVAKRTQAPTEFSEEIDQCRITDNLCALKQAHDNLGFRFFETWYARKQLFTPLNDNLFEELRNRLLKL